ncbi:MAG: glycosyltransferase family 1 protein [Candidatus Moranbacteria bacterium]|nr:glycosyltransferase family 1 protein [Candidatus Moranbacteria bacterium]
MKIAIHASDLDHQRIDGTRVYLANMLKNFGLLDKKDSFVIYHQNDFNPHLAPPILPNYDIKKLPFPSLWTQTRFAWQLFWDKPDVLWMPVHNVPMFRRKNLKIVVTIHDLAFKIFPQYFTKKDLEKLNRLSDMAIKSADRIIAISNSTKNDILKFFPQIPLEKITVVHHGFDAQLFLKKVESGQSEKVLSKFKIKDSKFVLYVGAIQPRKNLEVLIDAFEKLKIDNKDLKLVFAGAPAWKHEAVLEKIENSPHKNDIIITGTLAFEELPALYQNACAFVFPSLYEGFGIPILEAFASDTPVVVADNSSLLEVAGEAALHFQTGDAADLEKCLRQILNDAGLRENLVKKGRDKAQNFSWEKCAQLTLDVITKM